MCFEKTTQKMEDPVNGRKTMQNKSKQKVHVQSNRHSLEYKKRFK